MTTEHDLIAAIVAAPDDDAPRLVYADWLLEQGNSTGNFIIAGITRAACERASDWRSERYRQALITEASHLGSLGSAEDITWQWGRGFLTEITRRGEIDRASVMFELGKLAAPLLERLTMIRRTGRVRFDVAALRACSENGPEYWKCVDGLRYDDPYHSYEPLGREAPIRELSVHADSSGWHDWLGRPELLERLRVTHISDPQQLDELFGNWAFPNVRELHLEAIASMSGDAFANSPAPAQLHSLRWPFPIDPRIADALARTKLTNLHVASDVVPFERIFAEHPLRHIGLEDADLRTVGELWRRLPPTLESVNVKGDALGIWDIPKCEAARGLVSLALNGMAFANLHVEPKLASIPWLTVNEQVRSPGPRLSAWRW